MEGCKPSPACFGGRLLSQKHTLISQWTVEGVELSSAGCKPAVFPLRRHAHSLEPRTSGLGGSRSHPLQCVGQESNLHSVSRAGYSRLGSPMPSRHNHHQAEQRTGRTRLACLKSR
jgi:hypothetical protein